MPPTGSSTRSAATPSDRSAPSWRRLSEIFGHNLPIAAQGLLLLPGADLLGLPAGASTLFVALHLVGVAAAAAAIGLGAWRFGPPGGRYRRFHQLLLPPGSRSTSSDSS